MKKTLQILFAVLYLILTIGIQVSIHYCGDYAEEIRLYSSDTKEPSDCCGDECNTCCKTVLKEFRISEVQQVAVKYEPLPLQIICSIQPNFAVIYNSDETVLQNYLSLFHSPPVEDTNILNRTLRI